MSARARAVQSESPSGRRWEVMAIRFDALILSAMSVRGSAAMPFRLLDELVDPVLVAGARVQDEK
jgi:hypothetical protein